MEWGYLACGALVSGLVIAILLTPRIVEYVETQNINSPVGNVYDAIRFQRDLMRWSAWPSTTGSDCRVENPDGEVGARTAFLDKKGRKFGFQEVTRLEKDRVVEFTLESKGPPHKPTLKLYLVPLGENRTQIILHFINDISPPFHVLLRLFRVVQWTREMHQKDLDGLKRFCEPPYETYSGLPARPAAA
ncbi:MAG: hypothetical protein AAGI88_19140 [Pseudomonadota bacterium]